MKIGIIGTGLIGANLARKWSAAGHTLRIANDFDVAIRRVRKAAVATSKLRTGLSPKI